MFRTRPWLLRHLQGKFSGHPIEARPVLWTCVSYLLTLKIQKCTEEGSQPVPPAESADPPSHAGQPLPDELRERIKKEAIALCEASRECWVPRNKAAKLHARAVQSGIRRVASRVL